MKGLAKALAAVFILGLLFTGCRKDKSEPDYFQVTSDTTYALSWGVIEYWGVSSGWTGHGYRIYLASADIGIDEDDFWTGSGDYIRFELASSTATDIASGEYTYQLFDEGTEGHFDEFSYWRTGWNTGTVNGAALASGTLVVVNNGGDNYEFTFNGTDEEGRTVRLHYDGAIDYYYDYSGELAVKGNILTPVSSSGASR